jgi:hypothetical protein
MPFGFQCGDGWFEILWRLCLNLEPMVPELEKETGERFEAVQAKEKLGTLSFYVSHHADPIDERIAEALVESSLPSLNSSCKACPVDSALNTP